MFLSTGNIQYDPLKGTKHFDPWWVLLRCDDDIAYYYAWLLKRHGIEVEPFNLWGVHVSAVKGEKPADLNLWGKLEGAELRLNYENWIRFDNGEHAWLDVYSQDLCDFRRSLGLSEKNKYHLTVGRLKIKLPNEKVVDPNEY